MARLAPLLILLGLSGQQLINLLRGIAWFEMSKAQTIESGTVFHILVSSHVGIGTGGDELGF